MSAFKSIALIGRYNTPQNAETFVGLGRFLEQQGCGVMVERDTAATCGVVGFSTADYAGIAERADLAVVLGGDGSMLNAARNLAQ